MRVLVACEESQRVCTAFREKGHETYSCDILPCSGGHPEWHIQGDVLPLINGRCEFQTMDGERHRVAGKWDMLIAFVPCTFMTKAGARWMYPSGKLNTERYKKAMQAKAFFMSVWEADCERVVIENPTPLKCVELPQATQSVQPFLYDEFDEHPYSKKTLLWIRGDLPQLTPTTPHRKPRGTWVPSNTGKRARGQGNGDAGAAGHSSLERSKTPRGLAQAMADQWGCLDER